jgi:hypothetical protein
VRPISSVTWCVVIIYSLLGLAPARAQMQSSAAYTTTSDLSDVRPFKAWVTDATFTRGVDLEPVLVFGDSDFGSTLFAGARVAVWVAEGFELGGGWGFRSVDPSGPGDNENGLDDLSLYGRYQLPLDVDPVVAIGAEFFLPVGKDEVGAGNFDVNVFGAIRYDANGNATLLGHAGVQSIERGGPGRGKDREAGLLLGGGILVPLTEELALVSELALATASESASILGGVDFELPPGGHLRAAVALGLDDGSPDFELLLGFSIPVY